MIRRFVRVVDWRVVAVRVAVVVVSAVVSGLVFAPAAAGLEPLIRPPCGTAGGETFAGGGVGCGPRYCGAKHESYGCDPCDACNRWVGCDGTRQLPETLAPWQRAPGRGFEPPTVPCGNGLSPCGASPCATCAAEAGRGPRWATFFGRPLWPVN
jgi:hypothetical protein